MFDGDLVSSIRNLHLVEDSPKNECNVGPDRDGNLFGRRADDNQLDKMNGGSEACRSPTRVQRMGNRVSPSKSGFFERRDGEFEEAEPGTGVRRCEFLSHKWGLCVLLSSAGHGPRHWNKEPGQEHW